ncbi:MAG: FAD-dependent monooxygenase [Ginsengibacter sp.]
MFSESTIDRSYIFAEINMNESISIIGAGIGGLTTALALKQSGYNATVYESAPQIKPVGAGIVMAGNAMQIYRKLGMQGKIEKAGNKISYLKMTDEKLQILSSIPLAGFEEKYGVSNIAIHRADLQTILAEEVGYENIQLGKRLTNIQNGENIQLTFEDRSVKNTKIVIGADGIHSIVRRQLFKPSVIRDTKQICWRGVLHTNLAEKYPHEAFEAWGRGKRFGFVRISAQTIYWFAVVNEGMETHMSLVELFQKFHPDICEMIAGTPNDQIYQNRLLDLKPFSQWHQNNICLLGDAAHATTPNLGQGACQAIEDAYVLGKLFKSGKTVNEIFAEYEKRRIKKAHFIVNTSWMMGKIPHIENATGVWFRNLLMKMIPDFVSKKQIQKVFDLESK